MLFLVKKASYNDAMITTEQFDKTGIIDAPVYYAKSKVQLRRVVAQAGMSMDDFIIVAVKAAK